MKARKKSIIETPPETRVEFTTASESSILAAKARSMIEKFMPWGCEDEAGFHNCSNLEIVVQIAAASGHPAGFGDGAGQEGAGAVGGAKPPAGEQPAVAAPGAAGVEHGALPEMASMARSGDAVTPAPIQEGNASPTGGREAGAKEADEATQIQLIFARTSNP